jgi:hypothetical protein
VPASDSQPEAIVVDLSQALSEAENATPAEQLRNLTRLIAGEAYRRAWPSTAPAARPGSSTIRAWGCSSRCSTAYRSGPASLYTLDENFFPPRCG